MCVCIEYVNVVLKKWNQETFPTQAYLAKKKNQVDQSTECELKSLVFYEKNIALKKYINIYDISYQLNKRCQVLNT